VKRTAEGAYTFSLLLQVNIFRARQQSHKLSHADLRRIFDDVEEREGGERTAWLLCETNVSYAKIKDYETAYSPLYE